MNTETLDKKNFPFSCSKSKLYEMYGNQMPTSLITADINTIIIDNRRLPKSKTPRCSKITHKELKEFVALHGIPKGYITPEWVKE